jgi:uncharacterized cupredoxin-like copper-binding protein
VREAVSLTWPRAYNQTMRRLLATLVVIALAGSAPALAQSPKTHAPPGNSAIDEYLESVPSAGGNTPTGNVIKAKPRPLAGAAGRALRTAGKDGRRLEQIVTATAPKKALNAAEHPAATPPAPATGGDTKGRSPLSSVADAVLTGSGGGTGMGAAFPVLLIVLAAGTLVLGLRRRRPQS